MTEHTTARAYVADPATYPPKMTYRDLDRILRMVFVELRASRCVETMCAFNGGRPRCMYHPPAGSNAVGCAFAVLVPPHLRPQLTEGRSLRMLLREQPTLGCYFENIEIYHLESLQVVHDSTTVDPQLPVRMDEELRKIMEEVAS